MTIFDNEIVKIVKRITDLERSVRTMLSSGNSLYTVLNENTPAQITANMDNYTPGDYDALRISSDAGRNITGISSGKKGRVLWMHNVGAQNINLVHQSANSSVGNRIISPTGANITLGANDSARLYYDSTDQRWRITAVAN